MNRLGYLDGLRGVLALIVFAEHFLKAFYPDTMTHETVWAPGTLPDLMLVFSPLTYAYNGAFAVAGFFVMSGYVLTRSAWNTDSPNMLYPASQLVRRYFRFAVPITLSLLLILFAGQQGWLNLHGFIQENGSKIKDIYSLPVQLTFSEAIDQGFLTSLFGFNSNHNPVLWVMTPEMLALITVFLYGTVQNSLLKTDSMKVIGLISFLTLTGLLTIGYLFIGIWIGALVFALEKLWCRFIGKESILAMAMLFVGLAVLCLDMKGGASNPFAAEVARPHLTNIVYTIYGVAWGAIMLAILRLRSLQSIFETHSLKLLGKASFGLYLFHYPLLGAIGIPLATSLTLPYEFSKIIAGTVTLIVSILLGLGCYRFIERPIIKGRSVYIKVRPIQQGETA